MTLQESSINIYGKTREQMSNEELLRCISDSRTDGYWDKAMADYYWYEAERRGLL